MSSTQVPVTLNIGDIGERDDLNVGDYGQYCSGELDVEGELTIPVIDTSFDHELGVQHQTALDFDHATFEVTGVTVWLTDQDGGECGQADDYDETPAELAEWRLKAIEQAKQMHQRGEI